MDGGSIARRGGNLSNGIENSRNGDMVVPLGRKASNFALEGDEKETWK
jgi:hypothetical protein